MILLAFLVALILLPIDVLRGDVYSFTGSQILKCDVDLANLTVVKSGYGGFIDMAASSEALYFTNGDTLYRTDLNGSNLTSKVGIGVDIVAVNGDGYVYSYNGSSILRHDGDLSNQIVYNKGYGGFVDMAASLDSLYFTSSTGTLYKTDLDGSNLSSKSGSGIDIVAVNGDGYIYSYTGSQILRCNADLSNLTVLHTGYSGFVDMAASSDALYFTDSTGALYRTDLDGSNLTSRIGSGIDMVAVPMIPEPVTLLGLSVVGGMGLLCRKRR